MVVPSHAGRSELHTPLAPETRAVEMNSVAALHNATQTPFELYGVLPEHALTAEHTPLAPLTRAPEMNWLDVHAAAQTRFEVVVGATTSYGVEPEQTVSAVQIPFALNTAGVEMYCEAVHALAQTVSDVDVAGVVW